MYKLNKALYGLKQASRAWFSKIDTFLIELGFKRSPNAHTFYKKTNGEEKVLLICIYIDDIVYMGSSTALIEELKNHMKEAFEMSNLGQLNYFLRLEVMQSFDGVFVCEQRYLEDILAQFNVMNCRAVTTPTIQNEKLTAGDQVTRADGQKYTIQIGKLICLSHSRPDIAFSVGVLSRFMSNPSVNHFGVGKRLLRYLARTKD